MSIELFITNCVCLDPFRTVNTYDANALSHGVAGQVLDETGAHAAGVTVQAGDLAPDGAHARLDEGLLRHSLAGLRLVDVRAALAHVELAVHLLAAALDLGDAEMEYIWFRVRFALTTGESIALCYDYSP